jgi:capsular polysaccharide biosynthesis protein
MRAEIDSLGRQIAFKEAEEQRLRTTVDDYQRRIEQVPEVESEWISLTRDYDTQQAAYKELLAKSEDAAVAAELEKRQVGEQFRVLDPARPPVRPTGVGRLQVNAIGVVLGLLFGAALAALFEFLDTSFRSAGDIGDVLQLPVLAQVPFVPSDEDRLRDRRRTLVTAALATVVVVAASYGFWSLRLWEHIK